MFPVSRFRARERFWKGLLSEVGIFWRVGVFVVEILVLKGVSIAFEIVLLTNRTNHKRLVIVVADARLSK